MLIEKNDTVIVIDPGVVFSEQYDIDDLGELDAVLYTHQHADHCDVDIIDRFVDMDIPIYANKNTAALLDHDVTVVADGDEWNIGEFSVVAHELAHCLMADGSEGPQNTGYLIENCFFHPGDGVSIEHLEVDNLAVPIAGPSVSIKDAFDFARQVQAKTLIPIHYDVFTENPQLLAKFNELHKLGFTIKVLDNEESTEI